MSDLKTKRIIYPGEDGIVSVIIPCLTCGLSIEEVAIQSLPTHPVTGELVPYKIVDASEIPTDRTFRNAWEYTD